MYLPSLPKIIHSENSTTILHSYKIAVADVDLQDAWRYKGFGTEIWLIEGDCKGYVVISISPHQVLSPILAQSSLPIRSRSLLRALRNLLPGLM